MKYNCEITINAPINKVIELFDNPDNLPKWQPGFISMDHIKGDYGKPGSQYRMKYQMGKREIEMIETVIERNLPKMFSATYEAKGVWNKVENEFHEIEGNQTKYIATHEFKMSGFMKFMALILPGMFKKQSQKYMVLFKEFVEKN